MTTPLHTRAADLAAFRRSGTGTPLSAFFKIPDGATCVESLQPIHKQVFMETPRVHITHTVCNS